MGRGNPREYAKIRGEKRKKIKAKLPSDREFKYKIKYIEIEQNNEMFHTRILPLASLAASVVTRHLVISGFCLEEKRNGNGGVGVFRVLRSRGICVMSWVVFGSSIGRHERRNRLTVCTKNLEKLH
jgi:hypothetical protein